ncbi:MAG: YfhO family protein [Clostridia bacterium]|nr:YfhO family protein [Clostridia bacterium]
MKSKLLNNKKLGFFTDNRYSFLASGCTIAIMLIVYYCYDLIPFGDKTILRMDLYHQYGPLFAELYERVFNADSFLYSWTSGGGGTFLGNFYNYLSSPFAIVMLLAGHKNMPEAIAVMILLKAAVASFTFSYFIKKKYTPENSPIISAFGVLYACSGYFIAYYWNVMWIDSFYLFPLVMLGIDKIIRERKLSLYIVSLTLTFLTNYYMAYMVCIFSVLFFIYDYFVQYDLTSTYFGRLRDREKGIKNAFSWATNNLRNARFFDTGVLFAFSSVISACLSAFSLLPVYYVLRNCSATSGTFPETIKTYFSIFDFLANHLAYLDPTIRSSGDDVLPNVYCGVLTVMLVPLFIFSNHISGKEKIFSCGILGIMFASCYTNYLNYIWHGFHFPNDLPYRFSYMYSFLLLIFAFRAFTFIKEYTRRQIIGVGTATVFFVIMVQEIGSKNFSEVGVWICVAFIGIYCLALGILKNDQYPKIAAAALILCSCCAEYIVANTNNYSMDQNKTNFVSDYDDFQIIKDKLDEYEKNDNYRMELTSLRARMDPCWYYYNGMSTFSSMAYEKVSNMQYHLGMFSNYINSYTYNRQTPVYNAFFALDYIVDNDMGSTAEMNEKYYERLFSKDKYTAYKNNYTLPIAFRANEDIEYWSHENSNPFEVQSALFETATGINDVFNDIKLDKISENSTTCNYDGYGDSGCYPYTVTGAPADASLTYELVVQESGNGYLYFKTGANSVERITVSLSNGTAISQPIDTKPYILDLGYLEKGEKISVYAPITDGQSGYTYLYAVTLDDAQFVKGYNQLKKDSLKVTSFEETKISGKINASEDGILYTSINYDTGWKVYIDGKEVAEEDIVSVGEALLGVRITKGAHKVTFSYTPDGLILGAIVSTLALITLILLCYVKRLKIFKFNPALYEETTSEEIDVAVFEAIDNPISENESENPDNNE